MQRILLDRYVRFGFIESYGSRLHENVDGRVDRVLPFPQREAGIDVGSVANEFGEGLAAVGGPVDDRQLGSLGEGQLSGDRRGGRTGSQNHDPLACGIGNFAERVKESAAVGVVADEPVGNAADAVHAARQLRRGTEFIEIRNHGLLMGNRQISAAKAHRAKPSHGVGEVLGRYFEREITPVEPGLLEGLLHHVLRGVASHGLAHAAADILEGRT